MTLSAGRRLGPYEILAPIGAGGMGEVYQARDTRLQRTVAVKVLPGHLSEKPAARERFEREARAISSLNHPNVCHLYDVGSQDGTDYLVMEYLEGTTLADRLAKGALPLDQVLKHGAQICEGLQAAHRAGVVHRDLKPGNIMLTKAGVKLLDFGLAKGMSPETSGAGLTALPTREGLTQEGTIVGTIQYMAPEQLEGRDADARTDIFALGSILYEMATGMKAFSGRSQASLISAIMKEEPRPISQVQPMSPPALDRVVRTCLAKDPEARFQSSHDVRLQLQWIEAGASSPAAPSIRRGRERPIWAASVAVLLMALAALYFGRSKALPAPTWSAILAPEQTSLAYFTGPVTVSHDGRQLAFVATDSNGQEMIWVRSLGAPDARVLPGTEGASYPFWSADDRQIGFFAGGKLKTILAAGGPALTICDAPGSRGGTWNQDGVILFGHTWGPIFRVRSSGGQPTEATKSDPSKNELSHRWPYFLPDGRHFLFLGANFTGGSAEAATAYLGSLDSMEGKFLFHARSNLAYAPGYLLYVRNRMLMAQRFDETRLEIQGEPYPVVPQVQYDELTWRGVFSCSSNGTLAFQGGNSGVNSRLLVFDRSGRELRTIGAPADFIHQKISPDGRRLAVAILDSSLMNYQLWLLDLFRDQQTRLTYGPNRNTFPIWAPDGNRILFSSNQTGRYDMFERRSDSTGSEVPVLQTDTNLFPTDWSGDGRFITYVSTTPESRKTAIWILPRFGERKPYIFLKGDFNLVGGQFSPDGRWFAYASDESGRAEVYVTPFPAGGSKWQVSQGGGSSPKWRRDSRELFYLAADSRLMAAEVETAGPVFQTSAVRPLFHVLLRTGPSHQDLSPTASQIGFDASPDGKWFVVNSPPAGLPPPITLVTGWTPDSARQ
jgi:eukaryotic-like serine/threonine-protein kinase